jgi:hypothetical protein
MPNTNKCWDCIHCLRGKVRKGAELVTGEYGNCLSESSPLNKGKTTYAQVSKDTVTVDCEHYRAKTTK